MVRDAIARHGSRDDSQVGEAVGFRAHASHGLLPLLRGDGDGACLIEAAVRCSHCGYCLSLGH